MINYVKCDNCGKEVYKTPYHLKAKNHFCSNKCRGRWMSKNIVGKAHPGYNKKNILCDNCGKLIQITPYQLIFKNHFCNRKCFSKFKKGKAPWNKGLKGVQVAWNKGILQSQAFRDILSKAHRGKHIPKSIRRKMSEAHKGKVCLEETKKKIAEANKERPPWNKGKKLPPYSKERIRKSLQRRIPSSLEEKFQKISHKYNLPYKFVGNGSFILGNYNPDFININNKKIAIEVYDRYYKKRNYISIEEWRKKRAKIFKEFGWKIMFFDETEVNEDYVLSKLGGE